MALTNLPGASIPWFPALQYLPVAPSLATTLVLDATGEKAAFCGRVTFPARTGTKDIERVGIRFGAVTKSGGSALTISLQNVSTAAGQPMQPDETQDQTVAVANADATFVSNTWHRSGTLSANRTVSCGDLLSVVIEYDGNGRLSSDSVVISGMTSVGTGPGHGIATAHKTASWATIAIIPNVVLEFSDGSFGTLLGAFPISALNSASYNTGSGGADEYALEMTFPGPVGVDGAGGNWNLTNNSTDAELIFYEGTTAMTNGTIAMDGMHTPATSQRPAVGQAAAVIELDASTTYRLALKPTTANNITLHYFDVADANHLTLHPGGVTWCLTSRIDAGSWAAVTATRRPFLWPYVCAIDDAAGGGGGGGPLVGGRLVR
jgi:hypothetical protein